MAGGINRGSGGTERGLGRSIGERGGGEMTIGSTGELEGKVGIIGKTGSV